MIKIFTDSTAYIPERLRQEYDISIIPIIITINGESYLENELPSSLFYQLMEQTDTIPQVSTPDVNYIAGRFHQETSKGNIVLGIFMSSKLSGLFSLAQKAKEKIQSENPEAKIHLVDSGTNGMQMGLAVLAAASANRRGQWLENAAQEAYEVLRRSRYLFIPGKLKYVSRGGNLEKGKAVMGDLVHLCPIMTSANGEIVLVDTVHSNKRAVDRMIEIMDEDAAKYKLMRVVVVHVHAKEKAEELKARLADRVDREIIISQIGASVGHHVGPGTIGLVYQTEEVHPLNEHIIVPKHIL